MNWFKNLFTNTKDYPEFWQDYLAEFKQVNHRRIVVLDCETTGLNPSEDKILSIGAVALHEQVICVKDHFSAFVKQTFHKAESVAVHGIVNNKKNELLTEKEAIIQLLQFIGSAKIVGHHIQFDIEMINQALIHLQLPKLKNKVQDTSDLYLKHKGVHQPMQKSLDDLCEEFKIPKKDRHTALGDAFLTAQVYQRLVIQ